MQDAAKDTSAKVQGAAKDVGDKVRVLRESLVLFADEAV